MDPSNVSPADGLKAVLQNGDHEEPADEFANDVDGRVAEITETVAPNGNLQNVVQLDNTVTDNSSTGEIIEGSNNKEEEVKFTDQTELPKAWKGLVKSKYANAASQKGASLGKRSKDGKDEEVPSAPNGTVPLNSHTRQPIKSRSFNDRKTQSSKSGKSDAAPAEAPMEKTKPKSLKKDPLDEVQAEEQSSSDAKAEDAKPPRVGTLPNYGFSFKCDERAQRRKEFYSKLEEKIHAKEVEKNNLQAKTKETQEAEIKMLRKTLAFKATPMPSFYQGPPPPKAELKKIPTTRAKSPKLGRRKSSTNAESEGNTSSSRVRQGRLSLDEKVSESIPTKGISPVHQKKPQRRSLPSRLPSDRTSSSNSTSAATSSKPVNDEKTLSSVTSKDSNANETGEEKTEMATVNDENNSSSSMTNEAPLLMTEKTEVPSNEPNEMESHMNGDILVEEQPQLALVQEPIAAEH
ncbi:hypothetical protein L6164_015750 [Bauhinia variegata]|uniref:Uncharacterized protein n=1 Tax=Bauhinia variegata TaxID=167791 RepID=A0ACB9NLJ8_BAUVA|nr:hypothetical protein L6164_015750 [Bauhinia variegata]